MLELDPSIKQTLPQSSQGDSSQQGSGTAAYENRSILQNEVHDLVGCVWHDDKSSGRRLLENGLTEFATAAPLFIGGGRGYVLASFMYGLNEAKAGDTASNKLKDIGLGVLKGVATKSTFDYFGGKENWSFAARGVSMGVTSRLVDTSLSRQTYVGADGKTDIMGGLQKTAGVAFNPVALGTDVLVFGAAHYGFKYADGKLGGMLSKSPLLATAFTGSTFGFTSGALSELNRERQSHEGFNLGKVLASAGEHSLITGAAAMTGLKLTPAGAPHVVSTSRSGEADLNPHTGTVQQSETPVNTELASTLGGGAAALNDTVLTHATSEIASQVSTADGAQADDSADGATTVDSAESASKALPKPVLVRDAQERLISSDYQEGTQTRAYQYDAQGNLIKINAHTKYGDTVYEKVGDDQWNIRDKDHPEAKLFQGSISVDQQSGKIVKTKESYSQSLHATGNSEFALSDGREWQWNSSGQLTHTKSPVRTNNFVYQDSRLTNINSELNGLSYTYTLGEGDQWSVKDPAHPDGRVFDGSVSVTSDGVIKLEGHNGINDILHIDGTRTRLSENGPTVFWDTHGIPSEVYARDDERLVLANDGKDLTRAQIQRPEERVTYEKTKQGRWKVFDAEHPDGTVIDDAIVVDNANGNLWRVSLNGDRDQLSGADKQSFSGKTGNHTLDELRNGQLHIEKKTSQALMEDDTENIDPTDFAKTKDGLYFAKLTTSDGKTKDVMVRVISNCDPKEFARISQSRVEDGVNETITNMTGVDQRSAPVAVRAVLLPDDSGAPSISALASVQEMAGDDVGKYIKKSIAAKTNTDLAKVNQLPIGAIRDFLLANPFELKVMANAAFEMMHKGNDDTVEYAQQTIPETLGGNTLTPDRPFHIVTVDTKNDWTLQEASHGFGSQFGLAAEAAMALADKPLSSIDPELQSKAESLLNFYKRAQVDGSREQVALLKSGLNGPRIDAAVQRLTVLATKGFPPFLGVQAGDGIPYWPSTKYTTIQTVRQNEVATRLGSLTLSDILTHDDGH